jgi:biotin carboxyl carrier protein
MTRDGQSRGLGRIGRQTRRVLPGRQDRLFKSSHNKIRLFWQASISLLLLVMVISIFSFSGTFAVKAQNVIRSYVIDDYGMEPVFNFVESVVVWGDSFDQALPEGQPAAASISLPVDGQVADHQGVAEGIWIEAAAASPIRAAMAGIIKEQGETAEDGIWFVLDSGLGWSFRYSHCGKLATKVGDQVTQGQHLGIVEGASGTQSKIFVQVYKNDQLIDPTEFFIGGQ